MKKALFIVICLGLLSSCKKSADTSTFVYCSEGSPSAFNPQIVTDGTSYDSVRGVYSNLVRFRYGETNVEPDLAESWEISEDGLIYTFNLRKGVKFHTTKDFTPTRNFNADDVLWSFHRQLKKNHPYHKVSGGTYEYFIAMGLNKNIKTITKKDDYTVVFKLNEKDAPFLANLAMDYASILSKEYGDQQLKKSDPEFIDHNPVGTGPFVMLQYQKDTLIRYKRFEAYFDEKPGIEKLVFAITPDPSVRFQKLKTGECHLINEPSPTDLVAMKSNSKIKLMTGPGLNVGYLAMNVKKKPFDDVRIRKAVNMALNKASYIDAIYLGHAEVAKNPIPPTMWSYNKKIQDYEYNPARAKQLLAEAGYVNGFATELWTLPVSRPYNPNGKKMGEMMQADLAKVGIKVKLISYEWPTYLAKSKNGEHQLLQFGWNGDNGDPDNFLNVLLGCDGAEAGANRAFWCYKAFNDIVQKARAIPQQEKRAILYEKAQLIFKKQAPWVTLAHSIVYRAMRKDVIGYKVDPLGRNMFHAVKFKDKD